MTQTKSLDSLRRTNTRGRRPRQTVLALLLPLLLLAGFAGLALIVFGDRLRPRVAVSIATVLSLPGGGGPAEETMPGRAIAQASGWIEADPFPIVVAAKTPGYVESIEVRAGDTVTNGQLIATLDPEDRRLTLASSRAHVAEARSMVEVVQAELEVAAVGVSQAVTRVAIARADVRDEQDTHDRLRELAPYDTSGRELVSAEQRLSAAQGRLDSALWEVKGARAEVSRRTAALAQMKRRIETLESEAAYAELQFTRTRILAPTNGVVMERHAQPGEMLDAELGGTRIATLFDPERLQVRVDVPLSDVGQVEVGQRAKIASSAFPGRTFGGIVTRITGEADITRNTLQVKVGIEAPDSRMRPEMLCRVEFIEQQGRPLGGGEQGTANGLGVWVPEAAVKDRNGPAARVWVFDPVSETVSPRDVQLVGTPDDGLVSVREGLWAGAKVVVGDVTELRPGGRVRIEGEPQ